MDWTQVLEALQSAVITILIAAIGAVSTIAVAYINKLIVKAKAETAKIKDENTQTLLNDALERVSYLAETMVMSIEQESVGALKQAIADGKVDRSELLALKDVAVANVIALMTDETRAIIEQQIPDVENYVSNLISKKVLELRLLQASTTNSSHDEAAAS